MSKHIIVSCLSLLALIMTGSFNTVKGNPPSYVISGPTTVIAGSSYTYTVSPAIPASLHWGATGGDADLEDATSTSLNIVWSHGQRVGTVTINSTSGSAIVTLRVTITEPLQGGSITNSPLIQNINYNTTPAQINASVATAGACSGLYSYQWQSSVNNTTWSSISGATAQNFQPPALTTTTYYRRSTTCSGITAYTDNTATVNVYPQLGSAAVSPSSQTINYNTAPSALTVTSVYGGNGSYSYQWMSCSTVDGTYTPIGGATSSSYTPPGLTATTYFEVITTSNGASVPSVPVVVNVYPQINPGTVSPANQYINYNTVPASLSVTNVYGGNGSFSFQWQSCRQATGPIPRYREQRPGLIRHPRSKPPLIMRYW